MSAKNLILHRISLGQASERPQPDSLLQSHFELNANAGEKSELALHYFVAAKTLKQNGRYLDALHLIDKAFKSTKEEAALIMQLEGLIREIAYEVEHLQ